MEAMEEAEAESKSRPQRYGLRPLGEGEVPPYDAEAT